MFEPTHRNDASPSLFHVVPLAEPRLPAGFRRWRDAAPPADARIKAVLLKPGHFRVERGTADSITAQYPGWTPHAWQRVPAGQVLPPHWRAFPEAPPAAGLLCCVMFFDLRGQHGDVSGYGRYRAGWPFGDFEDRTSQLGDIVPSDSSRWAPYAWRTANAAELGQAHLASAFDASRHAAPQFRVAC